MHSSETIPERYDSADYRVPCQATLTIGQQSIGILVEVALVHLVYHISGVGLGLLIVHELVLLHWRTLRVANQEGEGSTFMVELPLSVPES